MSTDTFPLPTTYGYGYVTGQIIYAIADTAEDVDDKPQARAAAGKAIFTPMVSGAKVVTADYPAIVINARTEANLSASGKILDKEGRQGVWLIEGDYRVTFELTTTSDGLKGTIAPFTITVTTAHTLVAPLDMASAIPAEIPEGATLVTLAVPPGAGILSRDGAGALTWIDEGTLGGTTTVAGLTDASALAKLLMVAADEPAMRTLLGILAATETLAGLVELATTAEATTGTDTTRAVTPAGAKALFNTVVDAAPGALDTLNELAAAMGDDPNFATTIAALIASKVAKTGNESIDGTKTFTSAPTVPDASWSIAKTSGLQAALDAKLAVTAALTQVVSLAAAINAGLTISFEMPYADAYALGARPAVPGKIRVYGGATTDPDPTWMAGSVGDWRHIPVA